MISDSVGSLSPGRSSRRAMREVMLSTSMPVRLRLRRGADGSGAGARWDAAGDALRGGAERDGIAVGRDGAGTGAADPGEVTPAAAAGVVGVATRPGGSRHGTLWNAAGLLDRAFETPVQ